MGEPPHQLTAYERADRGYAIYGRVWDGSRYTEKRALHPGIRDEDDRIDPELEIAAQEQAIERQRTVAAGLGEADLDTPGGPLTLTQGFNRVLHPKTGKYASLDSEWRADVERHTRVIQNALGETLMWSQIRHAHYRKLWRYMAREHAKDGSFGARMAEVIVGTLQSAARWLQGEGWIEPGDALPAPTWKEIMIREWEDITGSPVKPPKKLRFTAPESAALWDALPAADPRLELAVEIGAELRLGQVARTRRSDVEPYGGFRFGLVRVHGRGKKRGETVVLTRAQRHVLTRAILWGHLANLEEAYQRGEIDDYYLITGGYLHQGRDHRDRPVQRARVENAASHWTRSAMRKAWKTLQELAGVEDVKGRNWYGMRRRQADEADALEVRPGVKNRLGGWTKTSTREDYLETGRTEDAEDAAGARRQIRPNRQRRKDLNPENDEADG